MTYSLTRFAIYETVRDHLTKGSQGPLPFSSKVLLGGVSGERRAVSRVAWAGTSRHHTLWPGFVAPGLTGGFVGTPADLVNVRFVGTPTP